MDDLLREFLSECSESMTLLDAELVRLERNPDDPELLAGIFRLVHTIKGTCGFLGLARLEAVAHATENVLGRLRDRELAATPAVITPILRALDRIKELLDALARKPLEPTGDDRELLAALATAAARDAAQDEAPGAAPTTANPAAATRAALAAALATPTLRVPVDLLEQLVTLVGELALTRNELLQTVRQGADPALEAPLRRLSRITGALQEGVMKTRMQAIGTAWSKLPRLVRDLAIELGKPIELELHGAETELDRRVLELISDPLTHMVRNAADHGLEPPDERRRLGKPEAGTITLRALYRGDHVAIQVADDGRGLDTERIAEQAVARGLVAAADLAGMAAADLQHFVFRPGFSTAGTVTAVSGRGVGLDVVRTNIGKIGGSVEIRSKPGRGSVFTIKIPLTLARAPEQAPPSRLERRNRRRAAAPPAPGPRFAARAGTGSSASPAAAWPSTAMP